MNLTDRKKMRPKTSRRKGQSSATSKLPPFVSNKTDQVASQIAANEAVRRGKFIAAISSGKTAPPPIVGDLAATEAPDTAEIKAKILRPNKPTKIVIRNKTQVIREAALLIRVLEETLAYKRRAGANEPPPELWQHLKLSDPTNRELIAELVEELKKLNNWLEGHQRATTNAKLVADLRKVGLKVLTTYGKTVAVGAGVLTIGALCTLLQHIGLSEVVENANIWKSLCK